MEKIVVETICKDMYKIINEIKKCRSKSRYTTLINEYNALHCLCKVLEIEQYPNIDNYSNKSIQINDTKNCNDFYNQIFDNEQYHLEFSNNYYQFDENKYKNQNNYYIHNIVSMKENIQLMEDFLNTYDVNLLKLFNLLLNENRFLIIPNEQLDSDEELENNQEIDTLANTYCSFGDFLPYVTINFQNNISDSINLIHELAHCYDNVENKYTSNKVLMKKRNNCLEEAFPYYLSYIYMEYLKKQNLYIRDIEHSYIGYNYTSLIMLKGLYESFQDIEHDTAIDDELSYSYGIVIAYHFLDRYLNDPEKTKKETKDFLLFDGQYDMMEMLEKFNLKEELINSKILKKYI